MVKVRIFFFLERLMLEKMMPTQRGLVFVSTLPAAVWKSSVTREETGNVCSLKWGRSRATAGAGDSPAPAVPGSPGQPRGSPGRGRSGRCPAQALGGLSPSGRLCSAPSGSCPETVRWAAGRCQRSNRGPWPLLSKAPGHFARRFLRKRVFQ